MPASMGAIVYFLVALAAFGCAWLLLRGYGRSGARLLLWAGLCFVFLTLNNVLVFVDLVLVPTVDLTLWRNATALIGVGLLLYGLVWDTR